MRYSLEKLTSSKTRETILLAEIAGLLHNLGKLDPNFLSRVITDNEKDIAKCEVLVNFQDIPNYHFQRFAHPDPDLIKAPWRSRLSKLPSELPKDLETEVGPRIPPERIMGAIQKLVELSKKNGPLYNCLADKEREARLPDPWLDTWESYETLRSKLTELDLQIQDTQRELYAATGAQRGEYGRLYGQLKKKRTSIEKKLEELSEELTSGLESLWGKGLPTSEEAAQQELEKEFRDLQLEVTHEQWSLADLLTLFWDSFFHKLDRDDYKRKPLLKYWFEEQVEFATPALLILSHGEVSNVEKSKDKDKMQEKARNLQHWPHLYAATAFGYDRAALDLWALQSHRFDLIEQALAACADPAERRAEFVTHAEDILRRGLGDTQWPINEIDLWDYASAIAALFKSGVARAILDDALPTVGEMRWRFLSVRFDGLGYLGQAHHVTDLLGRRASLEIALDAVQELLETTYPLGNEVYRDENGAVFIVPGWDQDALSVLALQDGGGVTLEEHIQAAFREATGSAAEMSASLPALAGELKPVIHEGNSLRGKALQLGAYLAGLDHTLTADPTRVAEWWRDAQAEGREICTVCGVRPVGWGVARLYVGRDVAYYREQADQRKVCGVCMKRRGRRAEHWLTEAPDATIWTDEVVDKNSRFALLVGKFDLTRWLDGALIPTMQKPASFARVQRCWETTEAFWNEVEAEAIPSKLGKKRDRLRIIPRNARALNQELGSYHTYELEIEGQGMGVVWDPVGQHFITTENLADLARRWDIPTQQDDAPVPVLQRWLASRGDHVWTLHEPSGYTSSGKPQTEKPVAVEFEAAIGDETPYTPYIPLLSEPSVFMALIPATQALDVVAAIRQAYEREMSKVQDRLPLHLGVVIAPRRTPLRAVLDAGRALLERPTRWEAWNVAEKPKHHGTPPADSHLKGDAHFAQWWKAPLEQDGRELTLRVADRMGDGKTEDVWHARFCTTDPGSVDKALNPQEDVIPVSDLTEGTTVYLNPATFDFEYLDTTARRFTIAYNQDSGRRLGRASRPYVLHHLEDLQEIWRLLRKHLKSTQLMWIHGLIEEKRRDWQEPRGPGGDYTSAFRRFVEDTLRTAEWKQGRAPASEAFDKLKAAAIDGTLADVVDLYHEAMKLNLSSSEKEA